MRLKKLETVGFKSFAERISVDFVPGVTAVVGPNGSGKSNITDAIRWVLGEQSAKSLRGSRMEDIIFAGSDSRKPLNVAEVTLILDNEDQRLPIDYDEVAVTRRVYRSGDSEYLINNQSCRLKDIVDLFMDSGLGKEAFSIISQGKVEEILSSKSEDRRTIFEEAAGVLKYKQRKMKAVKKLVETDDNLSRVEDIIHEIESQLEPLKEQAAIAKDYLEKKDELEKHEVSLIVTEIEQIHKEWEQLLISIDDYKNKLVEQQTVIQKDEAQIEQYAFDIQKFDQKIEELQEEKLTLTQLIEQLDGQKNVLVERLKHYGENKDKLLKDIEAKQDYIDQYTLDLEDQSSRLKMIEEERNHTKQEIEKIKHQLSDSTLDVEAKLESLKAEYIDLMNEQAVNRNEKASLERQIEQTKLRQEKLDERFKQMLEERKNVELEHEKQENDKKELTEKIHIKEQEIERLKAQTEDLQADIHSDEEKLQQGFRIIDQLRSKKEMLEEMKESYSGYYYGVKSILQAKEKHELKGIHGAVAQLINISDENVTAIETALGGQAQHIVVSNEQDARNAIYYLKKANSGRATFLPITTIKPRYIDQQTLNTIKHMEGFVGVAADLVQFDKLYHAIVQYLLGSVIIAKQLKDANVIAKSTNQRFRIVTLDGDVVNPGGSMSGGAKNKSNQASLFTREKELEEIKDKLVSFEKKSSDFQEKLQIKKQTLNKAEEKLNLIAKERENLSQEQQELIQSFRSLQIQLSSFNDQLHVYDQETKQYKAEIDEMNEKVRKLDQRLESDHEQEIKLRLEIDDLTKNQSSYKEQVEQLKEQLNYLQIKLAEQESDVRNQQERLDQINTNFEQEKREQNELKIELERLEESYRNTNTVEQLTNQVKESRTKLISIDDSLEETRESRYILIKKRNDLEREVKELKKKYDYENSQLQQLEVKANRLDVDLENRLNHLREEYMMTFEKAKADYGLTDELEETRLKVKFIKKEIDELGTVNLGSIEEYERVQERYTFLTEQQNDLIEAKETLLSIIEEMDEEMIRKFSETFEQIQEQFAIVFKELFGGGSAELKLSNPDDLLETGVDIIAQPPGKKLQHLSLLSGGERALTAIALLFAILRVRPVPFCVLDEVEAALDEANVVRYGQYLKQFSHHTQFIVITHRKGTMEFADVLYGVTMQESGVSKLVSVKLEETEEMILS
ncbi:chromosome segregation protein SMC [Bacillaceae bacterium W0354]